MYECLAIKIIAILDSRKYLDQAVSRCEREYSKVEE